MKFKLKKKVIKIIINKKKPYSTKKINLNKDEKYSTLNPETNSVSLSKKSKGVRFISLRTIIINVIKYINEKSKIKFLLT